MAYSVIISPRDPVIVRDGRPFDVGSRMKSLAWPTPSLLAGSLRSVVGLRRNGGNTFSPELVQEVLKLSLAGPLGYADGKLWLPAPRDIVCHAKGTGYMTLRPQHLETDEGCDLPHPSLLPMGVNKDVKATPCAPLWSMDNLLEWLLNPTKRGFNVPKETHIFGGKLAPLPDRDPRTHSAVDPDNLAVKDGNLFETVGLDFERVKAENEDHRKQFHDQPLEMLVQITDAAGFEPELSSLDVLHPLGGERRLARWRVNSAVDELWCCPKEISDALSNTTQVRMVLATPALFKNGWLPGWLQEDKGYLEGVPPGLQEGDVRLRLTGAVLDRWQPISGWSVEKGNTGPKPVRRMVGSGAVYFFDVVPGQGQASKLANVWLAPVSDDIEDRRDGFGLALWGVSEHEQNNGKRK